MQKSKFKSYENFLLEMYDEIDSTQKKEIDKISKTYVRAVNESKKMSMDEANQILESIEMPTYVREYIERESSKDYSFKYNASESSFKLVDLLPMIDESLNKDEEWKMVTEEGRLTLDQLMWEGIYTYITSDEDINEGLWGSIVSAAKKAFGYGVKGLKMAWTLVKSGGKILKGMLKGAAQGAGKVLKFAVGMGKKLLSSIKGKAEQRAQRLRQHSEEQVDKDMGDLGSTVSWIAGKGVQGGIEEGVKAGGGTAAEAAASDPEGRSDELKDLEDQMAKEKAEKARSGSDNKGAQKPNESKDAHLKHSYYVVEYMQSLDKEDILEFFAFCYAAEILEKSHSLNESINEAFVNQELRDMNVSEGFKDKLKKIFGFGDKEKEEEKTPDEKEEEKKLYAKDEEAIENADMPEEPEGNPTNTLEDKAKKAEEAVEKGEGGIVKILSWIGRLVIQGPVLIVEWIVEKGMKKGIKFLSACCKKIGGPGVFLMITIAAAVAIIVGLAIEGIVASGVLGEHSTVAKFFHMGAVPALMEILKEKITELALSFAKTAVPILKWIPVLLSLYFGIRHMKHILHDKKMGKDVNHSKAIELEEEEAENDRKEAENTDDEELKKMYQEKADLHDNTVQFHKDMRERKIQLTEMDKQIAAEQEKAESAAKKGGLKDSIGEYADLNDQIKKLKGKIKSTEDPEKKEKAETELSDLKKKLEDLKAKYEKGKNPEGGEDNGATMISALKKVEKLKHDLHHEEEALQKEFDEFFEGPDSPHAKIQELEKKIKERKKGKNESSSTIFSYDQFVKENEQINRTDYVNELRKSFINERASLREAEVNKQIDEWITSNLGIQIDEEFNEMMESIEFKDSNINEDELFEDRNDLNTKLKSTYDLVSRKFSGFKANVLDRWESWSYKESLPKEVAAAAKDLGVAFDNIIFFRDSDNPDAYNLMIKELPKIDAEFTTGTYKNKFGKVVNFAVVNNI